MVDYMIWPWFERLDAILPYTKGTYAIPYDEKFPNLVKISYCLLISNIIFFKF